MAIRNVVQVGDETLRKKCFAVEKFDEGLWQLLDDMKDTVRMEEGAGLAAPQGGVLLLQGGDVLVVVLLVCDPACHSGVGRPEGGGDDPRQIGQGGGGVGEKGHKGQAHGDHRRGEQDPDAVFPKKFLQRKPS